MKNSKSKVLMTSVIMLVVAVMALTTATYAWFISADSASVSEITMQAESASGIRFSVDGTNWKNVLTLEDLGIDFGENKVFKPTSTNFEDSDQDEDTVWDFYYVNSYNEENGQVTIAKDTANTGNYIAFSFYIQLDGTNAAGADGLWLTSAGIESDEGELYSALRVAFIFNGTTVSGNATVDTTGTCIVWQPGGAEEYYPLKDESNGVQLGTNSIIGNTNTGVVGTAKGADHKGDDYFTASPAFSFGTVADTTTQAQYKVTIVIWIEGQDPNCTNAVASQSITADFVFGFTAPEATPEEGQ